MYAEAVEWEALEFPDHERSADWYWILGIVVVVGALVAVVWGNTLFAILLVLGGFMLGLYATKHPELLHCRIDGRGIYVENQLRLFNSIESFWIDESNLERPKLLLTMRSKVAFHVVIPLGNADIEAVHEILLENVEEEEQMEAVTEKVMEWLKI